MTIIKPHETLLWYQMDEQWRNPRPLTLDKVRLFPPPADLDSVAVQIRVAVLFAWNAHINNKGPSIDSRDRCVYSYMHVLFYLCVCYNFILT